jgi:hypothetical protein
MWFSTYKRWKIRNTQANAKTHSANEWKILKSKWSYNNEQYFRLFIYKEKLGIGNKATFISKD